MDYGFRIWHDRKFKDGQYKDGCNGRTIAIIWDGDERYVGVAECSVRDQFVKDRGFNIALDRAEALREGIRGERFPFIWSFHMEETLPHEKAEFIKALPSHLFKEERQDDEHREAVRSEFA
jgi:hypothetical protein